MEIEIHIGSIFGPLGDDVQVLSRAEHATAARLHREQDRRGHIAGRSIVRRRLSLQSGLPPAGVPMQMGPTGQPASSVGLCFSIAHAGDLVVVAFAPFAVGVDVEPLVVVEDVNLLIALYGSPPERSILHLLPRPKRDYAFLNAWVRKEAILKASGAGITGDLTEIDSQRDVLEIGGRHWRVTTLPLLRAGYVAAFAVPNEIECPATVLYLWGDSHERPPR